VKRNPKKARRSPEALQVWTFARAQAAVPYIASIVRSLREHGLEALAWQRLQQRLADRPGRPDRRTLLAIQEAEREARLAQDRLQDAAEELHALDVFSSSPLQGQALVPFVQDGQLAWYIFDLFTTPPFNFWRFQSDPEETRRPLTAQQKDRVGSARGG
jgi:hypothetical protein